MTLSDPILMTMIVSATGLIGLGFKLLYSSKCKMIKCWGVHIDRDTRNEVSINMGNQTPNQTSREI